MKREVDSSAHEHGLVEFVKNRSRVSYELSSSKHRHKFTEGLAHFSGWNERFQIPVPSNRVLRELRARGAPDSCWIVSESSDFDARVRDLESAVADVVGSGLGTVISCIPGVLAFFEGESTNVRCILHRAAAANR